jgi:hypothetical protein
MQLVRTIMVRNSLLSIFVGLAFTAVACGGSSNGNPQPDGGVQQDTGAQFDSNTQNDATTQNDAAPSNNSFDTAKAITIDSTTAVSDSINPAGESNYYKFDGTAGDWLIIGTIAYDLSTPSDCDTVITLYDKDRTQIAIDDDAMPWSGTDSEIVIKLPTTGTYYVKVQDYSDWSGDTPMGGSTYKYQVYAGHLRSECTTDTEPNDNAGAAQAMTWFPPDSTYPEIRQTLLLGTFSSATDVDVYSFTVPATTDAGTELRYVVTEIMPSGSTADNGNAYGSTTPIGDFYITDAAGTTVLTQVSNAAAGASTGIWAPMSPGNYQLWVKHPATAAGANDFYVVKMYIDYYLMGDMEVEAIGTTGTNDTLGTAQALTVEASNTDPTLNRAGVMGFIGSGDVDYYSFTVRATDTSVNVYCSAAREGSGLTGLTVSVRKSDDTEVTNGHGVETTAEDLQLQDLNPGAGTYYLRLSATGQSSTVTSTFVHCTVVMGPAT